MKKFANKGVTPPGGFVYVDVKTGTTFRHISFNSILGQIRNFRIANGMPLPPGWGDEIEDEMCERYEPPVWKYEVEEPAHGRSIKISDVVNFVKVVGAWMADGGEFVPQEEAERRAAICSACPLNQPIDGCTPCVQLLEKISKAIGGRQTSRDAGLQGCAVCSCSNKAQVHIPLEVLHRGVTPGMVFPEEFCWKALRP